MNNTAGAVAFHSTTTGLIGSVFGAHTLREVLEQAAGGGDYGELGRYIVAALLNARSGRTPFLDEAVVRSMWNDLIANGYHEPLAGVRWGKDDILLYLKAMMP